MHISSQLSKLSRSIKLKKWISGWCRETDTLLDNRYINLDVNNRQRLEVKSIVHMYHMDTIGNYSK